MFRLGLTVCFMQLNSTLAQSLAQNVIVGLIQMSRGRETGTGDAAQWVEIDPSAVLVEEAEK